MFKKIYTYTVIIVASAVVLPELFAAQTFEEYKQEADKYCDASAREWNKSQDSSLIPKVDYPKLEKGAISNFISKYRSKQQVAGNDATRLRQDLNEVQIGNFTGYKTLEAARVAYRTSMNSLFACSVVSSRIHTIKDVQKIIKERVKTSPSDLLVKLDNESKRLTQVQNKLKCNSKQTEKKDIVLTLWNSASKQYCHYRHYLWYLESSMIDDINWLKNIEKDIWDGKGTKIPQVTEQWVQEMQKYNGQIAREITRANATLPRAIRTFIEMDQTYGIHIVLLLIYDDYIKLRDVLSKYMNASSQLYQKAHNAQNKNMH